jgi:hypothetical protein
MGCPIVHSANFIGFVVVSRMVEEFALAADRDQDTRLPSRCARTQIGYNGVAVRSLVDEAQAVA